jgi:hypothetical protein
MRAIPIAIPGLSVNEEGNEQFADDTVYGSGYVTPDPGTGSLGYGAHGLLVAPPVVYPNWQDGQSAAPAAMTTTIVAFSDIVNIQSYLEAESQQIRV